GLVGRREPLDGVLLRGRPAGFERFLTTALDIGVGFDTGDAGVVVTAAGGQRQDRRGENTNEGAAALELHSSPPDTSYAPGPSPARAGVSVHPFAGTSRTGRSTTALNQIRSRR